MLEQNYLHSHLQFHDTQAVNTKPITWTLFAPVSLSVKQD